MKEIQAWLGHSTIGTTANIYTHLDENSKINSANAIIGILEQKKDTQSISSPSVRWKNGAANRTRTGTESLQVDFKSTMSTYSIIAAYASLKNEGWKVGGMFWRDAPNFPNFKFKKLAFL